MNDCQVPVDQYVLSVLSGYYENDPHQYVLDDTLFYDIYYWIEENYPNYDIHKNEMYRSLAYLIGIGYVQSDMSAYRLTGSGYAYLTNPYGSSLAIEQRNLDLAERGQNINWLMVALTVASFFIAVLSFLWIVYRP